MKARALFILLGSIFVLVACGRNVDLSVPLDDDFVERLENYLSGSGSVSSLVYDESPSPLMSTILEWMKRTAHQVELKKSYTIQGEDFHLKRFAGSVDSTLFFHDGRFYKPANKADGFVILQYSDTSAFSIGFYRNENGRLYVPDLAEVEFTSHGVSPPITYLRYSFKGLGDDLFDEGRLLANSPIAEIQLKNSVFGVSYESRHGIFHESGVILLPARGELHEVKVNYLTDCDGVNIEILKGERREKVSERQSDIPVQEGDSRIFKFEN